MFCSSSSLSGRREEMALAYLPDELMLNILARVSRCYYPSLSLVSKRFHSLITSKELYKTRKLLGTTESCLHIVVSPDSSSNVSLLTLTYQPTRPIFSGFRSSWKNVLVSVPTHPSPQTRSGVFTPVGSDIYMIGGGTINWQPSSKVFVLDCRSHTWHEAPSMSIPRIFPLVTVIDETIYVMERHGTSSRQVIEFLDTKSQIWGKMQIPARLKIRIFESCEMNGNLHLFGEKRNVVYKPKENKWDEVDPELPLPRVRCSQCVVDNVKYRYSGKQLEWWDSNASLWCRVKGCENLDQWFYTFAHLVNYGGNKIAMFWKKDVFSFSSKEKMKKIWFAEVTLEKRNNGQEIHGKVRHRGVLLTVPEASRFGRYIVSTV